jgi:hypothetical protein
MAGELNTQGGVVGTFSTRESGLASAGVLQLMVGGYKAIDWVVICTLNSRSTW